jgi:nitrogen-specific signal transduction histidine kinase
MDSATISPPLEAVVSRRPSPSSIVDALPVMAALVRTGGEVVACNALAEAVLGSGNGRLGAWALASSMSEEAIRRLATPPGAEAVRLSHPAGGAATRWVEWSSRPYPDSQDLMLLVGIDATREVALQEHVTRTQWFETAAALSGGLAHDFNNTLAAILGLSEVISLRLPQDSPLQAFTSRVGASIERAKALVRRFSQFSRNCTGVLDAQPTAMVLQELLSVFKAFMPVNVPVSGACSAELPWCMAERHALEQILLNCAMFFRSRLRAAGGSVSLTTKPEASTMVMIEMIGSGPGLAAVELERVFDLNLTPTTTAYESGTALFTARRLAQDGGCLLSARRDGPESIAFTLSVPVAT